MGIHSAMHGHVHHKQPVVARPTQAAQAPYLCTYSPLLYLQPNQHAAAQYGP